MTTPVSGIFRLPALNDQEHRMVTAQTIAATVGAALLVVSQMVIAAGATVWSISALMHLPSFLVIALSVAVGVPTAWGAIFISILAFNAETDPRNMSLGRGDGMSAE